MPSVRQRLAAAERRLSGLPARRPTRGAAAPDPRGYPADPVGYANHVLRVRLTPDQEAILRHLLVPPCVVNVPSGNNTGKTFLAAVATSWWYDSFNPGAVYTTAPRHEHVVNVLWAQLRILRGRAGLASAFIGPKAPQLYDGPEHFALGLTAAKGESFKGRHLGRKLFVFDEATGLPAPYFDELPTMFDRTSRESLM